jgi:glycosyltransferase involved in cell wall biosynthesis
MVKDRPVLFFYTNMPTPYQLDFFDALKEHFDLHVVYFTAREHDRQWNLSTSANGYSVTVLENNLLAKLIQQKVHSVHYSNSIKQVALKSKADMVIVNGTYWSPNVVLAMKYSKQAGAKVYFWGEPVFPVFNAIKKRAKTFLLGPVRKYTDGLLAIGRRAAEGYKAYDYQQPIINIPYNINHHLFDDSRIDQVKLQALKTLYAPNNEIVILSSGSLIERKGMDTLIKAVQLLAANIPVKLLIIGEGAERQALLQLIGQDPRIVLLGFREKDDVPYYFKMADMFVFASRYDGWALVVNEAMSAGNAIICSKSVGAAYDLLRDGENALLCDADDVEGFSNKIQLLLKDDILRTTIRQSALTESVCISSEAMALKIAMLYGEN